MILIIPKISLLSGNMLKIIAAISMLLDHIGVVFFEQSDILRILGRFALPIFAYMIAEGCRYTKNKKRYFFTIFGLAAACQLVYFFALGDTYMSILVTFSLAILSVYALQYFKKCLCFCKDRVRIFYGGLLFVTVVFGVYLLNLVLTIDYGFCGCMLPVFASLFVPPKGARPSLLDDPKIQLIPFAVGLVLLAADLGGTQWWSLCALPILLLYSGKRGKLNMKYFFYVFYPTHLVVLQGISWLIG